MCPTTSSLQARGALLVALASLLVLTLPGCGGRLTPIAPAPIPTLAPAPTGTPAPKDTPAPAPTPTSDCRALPGRVDSITYPSLLLEKPIPVRVYVPPCHDETALAFPTLYLLHGYPFDETEWGALGLDLLVAGAVMSGEWPPFLVVMPRVPEPLFRSSDGGPYSYEAELTDGLVTFIDLTFHTDPRPDRRAIAGISRGGVWSLEIGLNNPDVFGGVAAISPALQLNSARKQYDPIYIVRRGEPLPPRIYLLAGDGDWAREATQDLALLLDGLGVAHQYVVYPGGHDDASWAPALKPLIAYLIAEWPRP
jgi:enterochelin esterase-like enzyme